MAILLSATEGTFVVFMLFGFSLVGFRGRKGYVRSSLSFVFNCRECFVSASFRVMLWKLSFVLFAFLLGSVWSVDDVPEKFSQEIECSKAGGICIPRQNCPSDKVSEEGQCPKQSNLGAVCCHSLSATETRCQELAGHCRQSCPEDIIIGRANDCPEGEKCCPLV